MKILKNNRIIAGALLAGAVGLGGVQAADFQMSGTVASTVTLSLSVPSITFNPALTHVGAPVGSATEICNDPDGYTVTVESANSEASATSENAHFLGAVSNEKIFYTIDYGVESTGVAIPAGGTTVKTVVTPTDGAGNGSDIKLYFTAPTFAIADSYSDTLTFTIAAR